MSACALTTEGNEQKTPKGASKEKTALDVELATAVKLKSSILAALSKGTTLCKTITGGDAGLVVCTQAGSGFFEVLLLFSEEAHNVRQRLRLESAISQFLCEALEHRLSRQPLVCDV